MRMSTDESRDLGLAVATIAAAAEAGVTVFDTARAYGLGEADLGHNEKLLASALRQCGADATARIVTKGGMTRPDGRWISDGRAKAILADCEASLTALEGLDIDLYLVHAPDPRTRGEPPSARWPGSRTKASSGALACRTSTAVSSTKRSRSPRLPPSRLR